MQKRLNENWYRGLEFLIIFIIVPVSFAIQYPAWIKMTIGLIGFCYVLWVLFKKEKLSLRMKKEINWPLFWQETLITFAVIAAVTTLYVWLIQPKSLFFVPLNKPGLFVIILFIYTFLSVWPQEIVYRTFYVKRYKHLFKSKALFVLLNGIVFSLAHIFFKNTLVLVLTFIGGILFAFTYLKFKSTTLVSMQHALYGNWLFTVGMGEMLAFPGMEQ